MLDSIYNTDFKMIIVIYTLIFLVFSLVIRCIELKRENKQLKLKIRKIKQHRLFNYDEA